MRKTKQTPALKSPRGGITPRQRRTIAAIAMCVIGVLLLLSIVSYSPADESVADVSIFELWKVFSGDQEIQAKADRAQNWLGLIGAIVSHFLVNTAFGYAVICLPLLIIVWGWFILRGSDARNLIMFTNYTIVLVVMAASMLGLLRLMTEEPIVSMDWSGMIGDYIARSMSKLIGLAGSAIVTVALFAMILVLMIDLDIQRSLDRIRHAYARIADWRRRKVADMKDSAAERKRMRGQERVERERVRREQAEPRVVVRTGNESDGDAYYDGPANGSGAGKPVAAAERREVNAAPDRAEETGGDTVELTIKEGARVEEADPDAKPKSAIASDDDEEIDYAFPSVDLLDSSASAGEPDTAELKANADLLREKLADFGVDIENVSVTPGPVLTLYELVPASGVKISRITSLANDLALALQAKGIRILAPIPGKGAVGVEIPNHNPSLVTFRSVVNSKKFHDSGFILPMAMGKTISGEVYVDDLARLPHLLIAGSTGSGKSVGINTIIASFLYRLHPSDVKFVIIDPKKIELTQYKKLERHYLAVSPDIDEKIATTAQNAVTALRGVEIEMEQRYDTLAHAGVRNIQDYNRKVATGQVKKDDAVTHKKLPYLIVIIDELADLMLTAAKDVEDPIARLAQLARAVGIHLIVATQRPSVDVITGVIKANFSARIAYQVAQKNDSRTILDMNGAEQLLGNGDMLYLPSGSPKPIRLQNSFLSTEEIERLTGHIRKQPAFSKPYYLPSIVEKKKTGYGGGDNARDDLFEEAAEIVVRHQQGSVSLIQRRLKVGYSRAARIIDELEAAGIVGPFDGSKARQVLVETDSELSIILESLNE